MISYICRNKKIMGLESQMAEPKSDGLLPKPGCLSSQWFLYRHWMLILHAQLSPMDHGGSLKSNTQKCHTVQTWNCCGGSLSREFAWHVVGQCSSPCCNRPMSLKQIVTALLPNARQQVWVSRPSLGSIYYLHTKFHDKWISSFRRVEMTRSFISIF